MNLRALERIATHLKLSHRLLLGLAAGLLLPLHAYAGPVTDTAGDFLATYTGPHNGDMDVLSADVTYNQTTDTLQFFGTLDGLIGTTPGALYVFGVDRGQGTERFLSGTPAIGAGVFFDMVVVVRPDTTAVINDFINNQVTQLPVGTVRIQNDSFATESLDAALFPSTGFETAEYTWNLWPRQGLGANVQISDFAPDAANVGVSAVPVPSTLALLGIAGLGMMRRLKVSAPRRGSAGRSPDLLTA